VGYPKRRGVVNGAAEFVERNDLDIENFPGQYPAIRLGWSLWEDIDQTSGDLWVSIDFCEGQVHNTEQINWARDFTVAEVFDFRTGNHVAEYISQKLHSDAALDIFRFLCFCRKSHPAQQWPYVIWESPHGKAFQQLLIQHEYDWHRIFFRIKDDGLVEPSVETMGIYPSPAKRVERVQLGSQAIASRRFMNRSDLVARQAEWLIRKGTKYEAIQKDGKGE